MLSLGHDWDAEGEGSGVTLERVADGVGEADGLGEGDAVFDGAGVAVALRPGSPKPGAGLGAAVAGAPPPHAASPGESANTATIMTSQTRTRRERLDMATPPAHRDRNVAPNVPSSNA